MAIYKAPGTAGVPHDCDIRLPSKTMRAGRSRSQAVRASRLGTTAKSVPGLGAHMSRVLFSRTAKRKKRAA
jgi:hypothetical protein